MHEKAKHFELRISLNTVGKVKIWHFYYATKNVSNADMELQF